jgi:hypothetical protein
MTLSGVLPGRAEGVDGHDEVVPGILLKKHRWATMEKKKLIGAIPKIDEL